MSADNVEYLKNKSSLLDEANSEIIKSLETKKDEYAEVYYMNKNKTKQGAFRYIQTGFDKWLSPTNAQDSLRADKVFEDYKENPWKALEILASEKTDHKKEDS